MRALAALPYMSRLLHTRQQLTQDVWLYENNLALVCTISLRKVPQLNRKETNEY